MIPASKLSLLLLLLIAGCSPVRFISEYDEQTDRGTTELHRKLESLLVAFETAEPEDRQFVFDQVFPELLVDLRALMLRASSRPMNELQVEQFAELDNQLRMFGEAQREGIDPREIALFRRGFDQTFRAILTLELAKKRGAD